MKTHIYRDSYHDTYRRWIRTLCGRVITGEHVADRPMDATCETCHAIHIHKALQ